MSGGSRSGAIDRVVGGAGALAYVAAFVLLWVGGVLSAYAPNFDQGGATLRYVETHRANELWFANVSVVYAALYVVAAMCFVGAVRGPGAGLIKIAAGMIAVGAFGHVVEATVTYALLAIAAQPLPAAQAISLVGAIQTLVGPLQLFLAPFLMGILLMPFAVWRAGRLPLAAAAIFAVDMMAGMALGAVVAPLSFFWFLPIAILLVPYTMTALGLARASIPGAPGASSPSAGMTAAAAAGGSAA